MFTHESALCEAALSKGYVSNWIGGCAIVRVRPLDKPVNGLSEHGPFRLSNSIRLEDVAEIGSDSAVASSPPNAQQQDVLEPVRTGDTGAMVGSAIGDDARELIASPHLMDASANAVVSTTKTVRTETVVTTTSEVHTTGKSSSAPIMVL